MRIIKVNAINSTNEFVRDLYRGDYDFEPVCVTAHSQTAGKGQRGAGWLSNAGENLTFSILYPEIVLQVDEQFLLSAAVSLAVTEVLEACGIPKLKVKWPNDIMSGNRKICGILIENILKNDRIAASVIGIGLNVNQEEFPGLPQAGSLRMATGNIFELDKLLEDILKTMEKRLQNLSSLAKTEVLEEYAARMFRRNQVSTFQLPDGSFLTGIIRGVTTAGRLNMEVEDSVFRTFELKEVKLMF